MENASDVLKNKIFWGKKNPPSEDCTCLGMLTFGN